MDQTEKHYRRMTQMPVDKLILSLAVPTVISMLISNIYNLADTYFVGALGVSASAAVGIVFTLMNILQAVGFMLGHGSGTVISRLLADRDVDRASKYISTSFFMALFFGGIFVVAGMPMSAPLMRLLGSTETILPYAQTYALFILGSAPFMVASLVLNNVLRYEGKAAYGMIGLTLGGILNMIGDPILIYGCNMGVAGAGLSTAISQAVSFFVLLIMFKKHAQSRISLRLFAAEHGIISDILTSGSPNLFRQGLSSVSTGMLNHCAKVYGDACVSAISITNRCQMFMFSIALGISQGFQPVSGFNYQAKKYARLRKAFRFTLVASYCVLLLFCMAGLIFAPQIVSIFQGDPSVITIGSRALRFSSISLLFIPLNSVPNMLLQSTGKKITALFTACLRGGLCLIPLLAVLPALLKLTGVEIAQPCADVLSALLTLPIALSFFKKIPKTDEERAAE